ncbi:BglG family transcription antiterminator [uncultured Faecalibaculum sp.]|uniref:BglG family transcription antiterminator n=1 Tax=uncultured Faecalibaculum sp. TaxID=1729681 RepID=UPI002626D0B8|nr:BglG family transcription antiterminator [uncultured Faecalibaculum sp.]
METELKAVSRLVVSKKRMSVDEICEALGLSRRQVLYRLEKINQILSSHKVPPVVVGHVLVVDPVTREALLAACQGHARLHEYEFTPAQRQLVLYLMLFEGRDRLILQDFMEALDVSRNTVLADLKQLRQSLEAADIQLVSDRRRGYQLRGEETALRSRLIREVMQEITAIADVQLFDLFLENSGAATFPETEALCLRLAKEHGIRFAADRMTEFIYMYLFLRQRIQNTGIHGDVHWPLPDCPEKRFVQGLLKETGSDGFMVSEEVSWLTSWILGISFGSVYEDTEDCLLIADITGRIMSRFEQLTGIRAPCQEDMFTRLYSHIRPAYYRLLFGIPILNPLTEKVKQEYPDLYQIVARAVKPACSLAGREFPEDEIAYLTMHFAVLYEGMHPAAATSRSRALILCRNGVGSSAVLHAVLTELFPQLAFETADSLDLGPGRMPPDIIFAARSLTRVPDTDIPVVTVSPVMDEQEKLLVLREVNSILGQEAGTPDLDMVLSAVRRCCTIQNEEELRRMLQGLFTPRKPPAPVPAQGLLGMMDPSLIAVSVSCATWQEAVRRAYQPLALREAITEEYIQHTIATMEIAGPYVVIAPHVALLHTEARHGARQPALSLTVFETPVVFSHPENDPVKYAFALSVPQGTPSHLTAMAGLLRLLEDPGFYAECDTQDRERIWASVCGHLD